MNRLLATLVIAMVLSTAFTPIAAQVLTAQVTGGAVQGIASDGVSAFKGIPFAAPPVGANRWRAPQPVKPWNGTLAADKFAPGCVQDPAMLTFIGAPPEMSEDCLYLNVWTPAKAADDKLPVMVWIYGGGFAAGATNSRTYEGTRLAQQGVVLVSIAYRVGAFGFLAHPDLTKESGKGSGNYGLRDQIAGLEWVRDNIAAFGGDPGNVTIFGESAGAISVSMLAGSPAAKGLFQKAISESGGWFAPPFKVKAAGQDVPVLAIAEGTGKQFLDKLGAADIAAGRALGADAIRTAQGEGLGGGFWPVADGDVLPGDQYLLYAQGRFNDTPVLIGTNSNEGGLFVRQPVTVAAFEQQIRDGYGARADAILAAYPHATDEQATQSAKDVSRDSIFGWHTYAWASLQSRHGKGKAYIYYFDHRTPQSPDGANHADELGYVFRTLDVRGGQPRPEDWKMSDRVSAYWVNFAKTGDPNGSGLPVWPAFTEVARQAMVFDAESGARALPNLKQLQAMDTYFAWRRENAAK